MVSLFFIMAAAALPFPAAAGGRAADADCTLFFLFSHIADSCSHQKENNCPDDNIRHAKNSFLYAFCSATEPIFRRNVFVRLPNQTNNDCHDNCHCRQAGNKACPQCAFCQ